MRAWGFTVLVCVGQRQLSHLSAPHPIAQNKRSRKGVGKFNPKFVIYAANPTPLICIEAAPPKTKQILQWKTCRAYGEFQKSRWPRQLRPEGIPDDTSQQLVQKGTQISIPRSSLHYKVGRQFDQS